MYSDVKIKTGTMERLDRVAVNVIIYWAFISTQDSQPTSRQLKQNKKILIWNCITMALLLSNNKMEVNGGASAWPPAQLKPTQPLKRVDAPHKS